MIASLLSQEIVHRRGVLPSETGSSTPINDVLTDTRKPRSNDAAAQYGSLAVSGAATFDGELALDLTNGFKLAAGDSFDILHFNYNVVGLTGTVRDSNAPLDFSTLSFDGVNCVAQGGRVWDCSNLGPLHLIETIGTNFMDINVVAAAVPEPGTWTLLITGILGLGGVMLKGRRNPSPPG
jgi:hypothetical protein